MRRASEDEARGVTKPSGSCEPAVNSFRAGTNVGVSDNNCNGFRKSYSNTTSSEFVENHPMILAPGGSKMATTADMVDAEVCWNAVAPVVSSHEVGGNFTQ
jgi:hypothetical protein